MFSGPLTHIYTTAIWQIHVWIQVGLQIKTSMIHTKNGQIYIIWMVWYMSIHGYMYATLLYYMYTHMHTYGVWLCMSYISYGTNEFHWWNRYKCKMYCRPLYVVLHLHFSFFIDGTDINVKCKCSTTYKGRQFCITLRYTNMFLVI